MYKRDKHRGTCLVLGVVAGLFGVLLYAGEVPAAERKGVAVKPQKSPPKAVVNAPVCNPDVHPMIEKVAPDQVRPGMKIAIKGSNFGKKECFRDVSFGSMHAKEYRLMNDSLVEATVPVGLKPGMMKVYIQTAGGTADDTVLVVAK